MKKKIWLVIFSICLILTAGFGTNNAHSQAYTLQELNQMRQELNLPALTGNRIFDFLSLSGECNSGIQFSCTFSVPMREQMEQELQQQQPADSGQDELGKLERIQRMQQNDYARQIIQERQQELNDRQQEIRDHSLEREFR